MALHDKGIPNFLSRSTSKHGDESGNNVIHPSDSNDDPCTNEHDRVDCLTGREQAEVLQQDSHLDQEHGWAVKDLGNVIPLHDS